MRIGIDSKQPEAFQRNIKNAYPEAMVVNLGESSGDLAVYLDDGKLILIEVKEIPDLVASIRDRRLFRQSQGIRSITPYAFLFIGGDLKYDNAWNLLCRNRSGYGPVGMTRNEVEGALTRVQASGVIVRYAYQGYVELLRLVIQWVQNSDRGAVTRPEPPRLSPFDDIDQEAVNWLTNFHGVGVMQARNFIAFHGKRPPYKLLQLATTPIAAGQPKPAGWTNNQIIKNRRQWGLADGDYLVDLHREEWKEELDE